MLYHAGTKRRLERNHRHRERKFLDSDSRNQVQNSAERLREIVAGKPMQSRFTQPVAKKYSLLTVPLLCGEGQGAHFLGKEHARSHKGATNFFCRTRENETNAKCGESGRREQASTFYHLKVLNGGSQRCFVKLCVIPTTCLEISGTR